jgi:hypothetical protein
VTIRPLTNVSSTSAALLETCTKTAATWDALLDLAVFAHTWLWPQPALRRASAEPGRRYERRTPAMALGLTDHVWAGTEFLATPAPISH